MCAVYTYSPYPLPSPITPTPPFLLPVACLCHLSRPRVQLLDDQACELKWQCYAEENAPILQIHARSSLGP